MVQLATQLAIFLENRPGTLARVCDAFHQAGINITALSTTDSVDHCVLRVVVSDPRKAVQLIEVHGCVVIETEVLLIESDAKPGSLAKIAHTLTDAGVNIDYVYCATATGVKRGLLVARVDNPKKAMKALNL